MEPACGAAAARARYAAVYGAPAPKGELLSPLVPEGPADVDMVKEKLRAQEAAQRAAHSSTAS